MDGSRGDEKLRVVIKLKMKGEPQSFLGSLQSSPYHRQEAKVKLKI